MSQLSPLKRNNGGYFLNQQMFIFYILESRVMQELILQEKELQQKIAFTFRKKYSEVVMLSHNLLLMFSWHSTNNLLPYAKKANH